MTSPLLFNIYMIGVGGQGIGLLSAILLRAADRAGMPVRGVDTHGLAQRGGTVISHLRLGAGAHAPLVREKSADLVIALERHEALRGLLGYARKGGVLVYYDAIWQPLPVRLQVQDEISLETLEEEAARGDVRIFRVKHDDLPDPRMQNIALLAALAAKQLIPAVTITHVRDAIGDLLEGDLRERNIELFDRLLTEHGPA